MCGVPSPYSPPAHLLLTPDLSVLTEGCDIWPPQSLTFSEQLRAASEAGWAQASTLLKVVFTLAELDFLN